MIIGDCKLRRSWIHLVQIQYARRRRRSRYDVERGINFIDSLCITRKGTKITALSNQIRQSSSLALYYQYSWSSSACWYNGIKRQVDWQRERHQSQQHLYQHHPRRVLSSVRLYDSLSGKILPLSNHLHVRNKEGKDNTELNNSINSKSQPSQKQQRQQEDGHKQEERIGLACYTCGPTTYAPAHIGHARTYVTLDILRRCIEATSEIPPIFVMNITDVDDKILKAAADCGNDPIELARKYEAEFWYDMDCLNVLRPHYITRVTEHVESDIVPYIQRIIQNGMAYEIKPNSNHVLGAEDDFPGVYFDVQAYEKQHQQSQYDAFSTTGNSDMNHEEALVATVSPDNSTSTDDRIVERIKRKRNARDFALWKVRKPNEALFWSSPFGDGRPGWHIECSAMIEAVQNQLQQNCYATNENNNNSTIKYKFVLHCGGIDLKFPHHTNEIAQANAYHHHNCIDNDVCNSLHGAKDKWIPHWVHTGHLHIHGLKMSKSLKNFITIQDMLSSSTNNLPNTTDDDGDKREQDGLNSKSSIIKTTAFHSPADDFRLWCLGLSGSYRSPTTYSDERRTESSRIRQQIVRFLMDGEELIAARRWRHQSQESSTKKWQAHDHELVMLANTAAVQSRNSLFNNDLDGSTFVEQLSKLADRGSRYIRNEMNSTGYGPIEPLIHTLKVVRDLLTLVGFSDTTCRAGLNTYHTPSGQSSLDCNTTGNVIGGERAVLDEFVKFRLAIRDAALTGIKKQKQGDDSTATQDVVATVLNLCDEVRDKALPAIGVELRDVPQFDSVSSYQNTYNSGWRYCEPLSLVSSEDDVMSEKDTSSSFVDLASVSPLEYFRVGQYEGQFLEYDVDGIPTVNIDGSKVSIRQLKKYRKKLDKHMQRVTLNNDTP